MRAIRRYLVLALAISLLAACSSTDEATSTQQASTPSSAPPTTSTQGAVGTVADTTVASADPAQAEAVMQIVRDTMAERHVRAVIVRVSVDGEEVVTAALGESMTGVPATTEMHFRNGAVAISYVATLLLQLVDEGKVSLDDKVSNWLPEIPNADRVTLRQLAQMTSGYTDYVQNPELIAANSADPFRQWTPEELIAYATAQPLSYEPGTNWSYSHTNYVILGLAIEKITGQEMTTLMEEKVLGPLGLDDTTDPQTAAITEPALHAFSSERRPFLQVPAGTPFYEESTFWNPSWTITRGAVQTTNIFDLHDTAVGIGSGELLSPESYEAMVSTDLEGKTRAQPGCPTCAPQQVGYIYGLGIISSGNWLMQNPLFGGFAAVEAYLPSQKVAIAVAVTFSEDAFDEEGNYSNSADTVFRRIAAHLVPDDAPPMPPGS